MNCVTNITNNIANPRQSMQRRMIIANLQVKLKHNYRYTSNSKLTYNLYEARTSDEILSENDLNNLHNWNIDPPPTTLTFSGKT